MHVNFNTIRPIFDDSGLIFDFGKKRRIWPLFCNPGPLISGEGLKARGAGPHKRVGDHVRQKGRAPDIPNDKIIMTKFSLLIMKLLLNEFKLFPT